MKTRNYLSFLFCTFSLIINAQLDIIKPFFSDSFEDSYQLNYGISLCDPEKGNYDQALKFLESDKLNKNPKNKSYLKYLIDYQTKGKTITFEIIDTSKLSIKEKQILKLWLFAVTKNDDDYKIILNDVLKKYPDDIEVKKIKIRKILQDRSDVIFTTTDFNSLSDSLQKIVENNILSKEDEIYFQLLKLDADYYTYGNEKALDDLRKKILNNYAELTKKNRQYFSGDYSKINFKTKCDNSEEYFKITNENQPGDEIFENYLTFYYGQPIADLAGSDNKKYVNYIKTNPLYYGEHEGGFDLAKIDWNKSPKKVDSYEQFILFIKDIDHLIAEFPGAKGPKMIYLDALITNKQYVYFPNSHYQTNFLKRIIDVFALDQRADFTNHFNYFRDILEKDTVNVKYDEYYKILFKQVKLNNEKEILEYLKNVRKEFPNNENLKLISDEFSKI